MQKVPYPYIKEMRGPGDVFMEFGSLFKNAHSHLPFYDSPVTTMI